MAGPLEALRVLDLTDLRGAMCGRMLADLGADVVRVGAVPGSADLGGTVAARAYRHANKRVVAHVGTERLHQLAARADVLVENLPPSDRTAVGLAPAQVRTRHPHLVHVAIADFGLSGPRAGWRLEPLVAQAAGGTLHASGFPDLPPCAFPGFLGPDCASVFAVIGAVAAVMDRRRGAGGQTVEISVQEATLAGTNPWSVAVQDYLKVNPFLPAEGRRNADGFYYVLPASDGWVRFVIGNEKQWRGAMALARHPDALESPEWLDPLFRRMNADVIRLALSDALRDRTRAELFEQARAVGATIGVIHLPAEYVDHPQTRSREVFSPSVLSGVEGAPAVRPPMRFSATPGLDAVRAAAPVPDDPWPERDQLPPRVAAASGLLLEGRRVIEFGMAAVGPEASLVLSELGADVIKIESGRHLDVLRLAGFGRVNCGFAFNVECRGRRSVTLNLETEAGRRLAADLCVRADVVVENYRSGVLDALGLGYESVRGSNPGVVYASSQGYGSSGPLAGMAAYGPLNLGFVGLHHLWNHPDAPYPCGTSLNHPDHLAGRYLAAGILAALDHRDRTGQGQRVELAQTEFAAYLSGEVYLEAGGDGTSPALTGNDSRTACPHGVFPVAGADRWIAVVVPDDRSWQSLCQLAGWEADPGLESLAGRRERAGEVTARLAAWTAERDGDSLAAELQAVGVSACPVMGPLDHLDDAHLLARRYIVGLEHPEVGSERHAGNPVRMSATTQRVAASAPCLGAHTAEVLHEVLGIGADEVERLVAAGVCV